jgi:type I restriction enzyme R subunit
VRQLVSRAVISGDVIDIFAAAGLDKPDVSILSDEFLAEVASMPQRNLAVETLRKLLAGEIRAWGKRNVVQARSFEAMLEQSIRKYTNRAIETVEVIQEPMELARQIREADARGEELGLTDDEVAFYDALGTNDSAVAVLGDDTLKKIARELVDAVWRNVKIDWTGAPERACRDACHREADTSQVRLPAGQAGARDQDGAGAGRGAERGVVGVDNAEGEST